MRVRWDGRSLRDARLLAETIVLVTITWLVLGWYFDRAITNVDGAMFLAPYTQSQLAAGTWTEHLYRFGVLGGAPMHDYAGTLPLVELCSALGLATTATLNLGTIFLQVCFGFFGLLSIEALASRWADRPIALPIHERLIAVWLCSFAPLLAWRLAIGHENILQGLLPLVVACALLWRARERQLSAIALGFGAFAVWNGVAGLGAQLIAYSVVFAAPVLVAVLIQARPWTRETAAAIGAVVAGGLLALPRLAGMLAYAASDDAACGVGDSVTSAIGSGAGDWLGSLAWTRDAVGGALPHERNYPAGALLVLAVLLWPRRARGLGIALLASAALAIAFASDVPPISTLAHALPLLDAFRVPARAMLPVLVLLPSLALAAVAARSDHAPAAKPDWLVLALAAALIALHGTLPGWPRELVAWLACIAIAVALRWRRELLRPHVIAAVLALVAALSIHAFDERLVHAPANRIEGPPLELRAAALAQAPELAMPLNRVAIAQPPAPFQVGLGFAAGLSSLDGDFNPTRRFLALLSALSGRPVPTTSVVFSLGNSPMFPVLQQLYNVRHAITFEGAAASIAELPPTPGPAWFPAHVDTLDDAAAIALAMQQGVRDHAWLLRADRATAPATCTGRVLGVTATPQVATLDVEAASPCTLVVATNYVRALRATANGATLAVFPIDIALTGIAVPAGRSRIVLAPVAYTPVWSRAAFWLGLVLVGGALLASRRPALAE